MKNWDVFIIVSTFVIAIALFASGKIDFNNMLNNLNTEETLVVMFKTATVALLGILALGLLVVVLLADIIISIVLRMEFPLLHFLYDTLYLEYFRAWFWDMHSGSHIFMACIILFGLGVIKSYLGPVKRKKTFVYHKTKQNNYVSH